MLQIHHHNRLAVNLKILKVFLLIILYSSLMPTCLLKSKVVHGKRFIIHVPMKIRTHHHTHTVYTHVHNKGKDSNAEKASKQTIYKIMGYSTHHAGLSTASSGGGGVNRGKFLSPGRHHRHHAHGHGYRLHRGGGVGGDSRGLGGSAGFGSGYGEINYDDYSNCDNCLPQVGAGGGNAGLGGDLIFNHFSRHDEEDYPDLEEEVIDDEIGDEWE